MDANSFIAGDWGTTRLRLSLCAGGRVLDTRGGPGIGALTDSPETTVRALIAPWLEKHGTLPILLCGMAGSRNGWVETPYLACPSDTDAWRTALVRFDAKELRVSIAPGLSCVNPLGAPDVMRGEETQVFGALAARPELARGRHLFCLPGTHTKWVYAEDGRIDRFLTVLTGELFAVLRDHSILARVGSAAVSAGAVSAAARDGFARGLDRQASLGEADVTHALFETRSRQLIEGASRDWALAFLSGLLIGSDVGGALGLFGGMQKAVLIGDPALTELYGQALQRRAVEAVPLDGADCSLAGLRSLTISKDPGLTHAVA